MTKVIDTLTLLYTYIYWIHTDAMITDAVINEARSKEDAGNFFTNIFYLSFYCKGSKGLFKVLHVRGCWRPNINFIFWPPLLMTVTLCLSCSLRCSTRGLGVHSIGAFSRAPSVGCGLPYHIWSLLSGILLATALAPNSTQLYNNSTPTRSPTGSLKSNV